MKWICILVFLCMHSLVWGQTSREFFIKTMEEWNAESSAQLSSQNDAFFTTHDLVFFYASSCPHCHSAAPFLKQWAISHQVSVRAYSFDNQPLPDFFDFRSAEPSIIKAAYANLPIEYPALFVMHKGLQTLYPVVVGEFNEQELDGRMQELIPKIKQFEAGRIL